jgi:hypothetical protein
VLKRQKLELAHVFKQSLGGAHVLKRQAWERSSRVGEADVGALLTC